MRRLWGLSVFSLMFCCGVSAMLKECSSEEKLPSLKTKNQYRIKTKPKKELQEYFSDGFFGDKTPIGRKPKKLFPIAFASKNSLGYEDDQESFIVRLFSSIRNSSLYRFICCIDNKDEDDDTLSLCFGEWSENDETTTDDSETKPLLKNRAQSILPDCCWCCRGKKNSQISKPSCLGVVCDSLFCCICYLTGFKKAGERPYFSDAINSIDNWFE